MSVVLPALTQKAVIFAFLEDRWRIMGDCFGRPRIAGKRCAKKVAILLTFGNRWGFVMQEGSRPVSIRRVDASRDRLENLGLLSPSDTLVGPSGWQFEVIGKGVEL